jgi:hypothetical protein
MNPYDLNNLNYIMSLTDDEFDEWMMAIGDDDISYAIELIQLRRAELDSEAMDIVDDITDFTEANSVINRIKAMK